MSALDTYDGTLHLYLPDDLYLVGSRAALIALRDGLNQALATGRGFALGPVVDGETRAVLIHCFEPLSAARNQHLAKPLPIQLPSLSRQERPQPTRAPQLAGVLPEYG